MLRATLLRITSVQNMMGGWKVDTQETSKKVDLYFIKCAQGPNRSKTITSKNSRDVVTDPTVCTCSSKSKPFPSNFRIQIHLSNVYLQKKKIR